MKSIRTNLIAFLVAGMLFAQDPVQLQEQGDLEGAAAAYRSLLTDHPNEPALHSNLGVVLSQLGRFEEAEKEYKDALRLSPANPGIELNLALVYYKSGRIPDASKQLAELLPHAEGNQQVLLL